MLNDIRTSLLKSQRIRVLYVAGWSDQRERERHIEPIGPLYNHCPCLVAKIVEYPPVPSLLPLDRIRQLEVLDETFERLADVKR